MPRWHRPAGRALATELRACAQPPLREELGIQMTAFTWLLGWRRYALFLLWCPPLGRNVDVRRVLSSNAWSLEPGDYGWHPLGLMKRLWKLNALLGPHT